MRPDRARNEGSTRLDATTPRTTERMPGAFWGKSELDRLRVEPLWEGYRESRGCSMGTYSESYIPKYTTYTKIIEN